MTLHHDGDIAMFVTVASYKGGAGKTTTAVHLAAYLQRLAPTLLIEGTFPFFRSTPEKRRMPKLKTSRG
jgi:Mrp family chromosome partitioning ATPase